MPTSICGHPVQDLSKATVRSAVPAKSFRATNSRIHRAPLQIAPLYPSEAKQHGLAGEVLVEFVVDESGAVLTPHVMRPSDRMFEETTLHAIVR